MKLTTKSRYALRAMMELAQAEEGNSVSLVVIAHRQGIAVKYLEQIFRKLHGAHLVKSRKGPGGGYSLARDPHAIRLSEVLQAVGESTAPVLCAVNRRDKYCSGVRLCPLQHHWKRLKQHIDIFFRSLTVADLCPQRQRTEIKSKEVS